MTVTVSEIVTHRPRSSSGIAGPSQEKSNS